MYDFFKVKGGKNHQEFKHPYFKRDNFKDLVFIRRKSMHKSHSGGADEEADLESEMDNKIESKLEAVRKSLEIVTDQNKNLIEANKKMIANFYGYKGGYETRLKKMFFLFVTLVQSNDEDLPTAFKNSLEQLSTEFSGLGLKMEEKDIPSLIKLICKKTVSQAEVAPKLVDNLLEVLFNYFESKDSPVKWENFSWTGDSHTAPNDEPPLSLLKDDVSEGFSGLDLSYGHNQHSLKADLVRTGPIKGFLFRETTNQNLFQSPTKLNEINFDGININECDENVFLVKRNDESFLMSGANSVLMLSPVKRYL